MFFDSTPGWKIKRRRIARSKRAKEKRQQAVLGSNMKFIGSLRSAAVSTGAHACSAEVFPQAGPPAAVEIFSLRPKEGRISADTNADSLCPLLSGALR
ncbi:hypothetical protein D3C78_923430 [compost metagenome]